MTKKGIILAGGTGSRLHPLTLTTSKQLLPVYDKPLIYYPLSTLMLGDIKDILIITTPKDINNFQSLLGDGSQLGIKLSYSIQENPNGLAEAFIIGESFIGDSNCICLILGDNIFYGNQIPEILVRSLSENNGATVFGYKVNDPSRYGVAEFDSNLNVTSIEEKPKHPKSNYAVTGLYIYDNSVIDIAKSIMPSNRGELEITDVNNIYISQKTLTLSLLGRGYTWLDTGTESSLLEAAQFIEVIENRQGLKIACIEEIAFEQNYITRDQLKELGDNLKNSSYGQYLLRIANEY